MLPLDGIGIGISVSKKFGPSKLPPLTNFGTHPKIVCLKIFDSCVGRVDSQFDTFGKVDSVKVDSHLVTTSTFNPPYLNT